MKPPLLALLALGLFGPGAAAEVVVRVAGNQVDIDASAVPLADVLDDLARQTGMEVVYEGSPPRQRVTLTLQGRSPAEAVQDVLEGQGLNYALIADSTGTRVQTLIITGAAGKGTGAGPPSAPVAPRRQVIAPPAAGPDALDAEYDDIEEDPFEDPALMEEEFPEEPLTEEDPALDAPPPEAVPTAPVPAAGPMPFPGGQPQVYPASPFTPQPVFPGQSPAAGAPEAAPAQSPP